MFGEAELNTLVVPKKGVVICFCVDSHKVNAVPKFNTYPMLRIEELLDQLGGACF